MEPDERDPLTHRARALFVSDPSASPWLVDFARANIGYGGTAIDSQQDIELLGGLVTADHIDFVVVLRSEREPSRQVLKAVLLSREIGKPVHALLRTGVELGLDVDEYHEIDAGPSWERTQELHDWGVSLPKRFGRPV